MHCAGIILHPLGSSCCPSYILCLLMMLVAFFNVVAQYMTCYDLTCMYSGLYMYTVFQKTTCDHVSDDQVN